MQKKNNFLRNVAATVACLAALTAFSGCGNKNPESVVINGVRWATRNVDAPGTFAKNPEDAGMYYQFNHKEGWFSSANILSNKTWEKAWEKANNPSPSGYRVPTISEIQKLLDIAKVTSEWTTVGGVNGQKFTDKATGESIFLPATGKKNGSSLSDVGYTGNYWSGTQDRQYNYYYLFFGHGSIGKNSCPFFNGYAVRPVAE